MSKDHVKKMRQMRQERRELQIELRENQRKLYSSPEYLSAQKAYATACIRYTSAQIRLARLRKLNAPEAFIDFTKSTCSKHFNAAVQAQKELHTTINTILEEDF